MKINSKLLSETITVTDTELVIMGPQMTNEERMRRALFCIGNNLYGGGDPRPISYAFACKVAELAFAAAKGEPNAEFDAACESLGSPDTTQPSNAEVIVS